MVKGGLSVRKAGTTKAISKNSRLKAGEYSYLKS